MSIPKVKEEEIAKLRRSYPDRIPILVTRCPQADKSTPDLKKHKFLVPNSFVFTDLIYTIRKWLMLPPEKGMYLFVTPPEKKNEFIPAPSSLLAELHENHKHRNGVLYIVYALENTFGQMKWMD